MSKDLKKFLQEWLEWAEGRSNKAEFSACVGLCHNYYCWSRDKKLPSLSYRKQEVIDLLIKDGLDKYHPFGGFTTYDQEKETYTVHKNPERLAWVRKQLCTNS